MPRNASFRPSFLLVAGFVLLGALSSASSATIVWDSPTTIAGDTDVSTTGSLVAAFNFGTDSGTTTVNGVSFQNVGTTTFTNYAPVFEVGSGAGHLTLAGQSLLTADVFTFGSGPFAALSDSYRTLLGSAVWNDSGNRQITVTIQGLTVGQHYQVQFWTNDSRNWGENRDTSFDSVALEQNIGSWGGVGQWVTGSFVADGATQTIIANAAGTAAQATMINAYQLRAIPEPSTYAAIAGAGALLAALSFRRRARANVGRSTESGR